MTNPRILIVMGVAGAGKTTIATRLAAALGCQFLEGDDLHPPANVEKMRGGKALSDADRLPWLSAIAARIDAWRAAGQSGVVACSALKRAYREILIGDRPEVRLVYLEGSKDLIHRRLATRHAHFMPAALLDSQFAALEPPASGEHPITVGVDGEPEQIVGEILRRLGG
jgi:carbohydrate kinase (thermoresistant glucokinase family)